MVCLTKFYMVFIFEFYENQNNGANVGLKSIAWPCGEFVI